jgi:hypothetical protein
MSEDLNQIYCGRSLVMNLNGLILLQYRKNMRKIPFLGIEVRRNDKKMMVSR